MLLNLLAMDHGHLDPEHNLCNAVSGPANRKKMLGKQPASLPNKEPSFLQEKDHSDLTPGSFSLWASLGPLNSQALLALWVLHMLLLLP